MHPTNCTNTPPAQDADNNLVAFPKSEPSPEDQAHRLKAEVDRLAAQSPAQWLYYLETGVAAKFGLTRVAMQTMIEKVIERNEKAKQEAKGEARREQTAKQKQDAEAKREREREQARLEKESARKDKAKAKEFKALVPLPSKDRRTRLAALAMQLGEDLDTLTAEFDVFIGADTREAGAIEPWGEPVRAKDLLAGIMAQVRRYVAVDDDGAAAIGLWTMFTWTHGAVFHSPILVVTSAEKDSGKSTLLGVLGYMVPRPYSTIEVTAPGLFHIVDHLHPTLIVDEADRLFQRRNDLLHVINSGWTRGTKVTRILRGLPREFDTFCPKLVGMKGLSLPDTLASRAIIVKLWPKTIDETVKDFTYRDDPEFETLRRKLMRWSADSQAKIAAAQPAAPAGFNNRVLANWKMLFAIADSAGCLKRAHQSALALSRKRDTMSGGLRLLTALQPIFDTHPMLPSADVVRLLTADKTAEWCEFRGHGPISQREVALLLDAYDVHPIVVHPTKGSTQSVRGYKATQFTDAFARYLPNNRTTEQPRRRKR